MTGFEYGERHGSAKCSPKYVWIRDADNRLVTDTRLPEASTLNVISAAGSEIGLEDGERNKPGGKRAVQAVMVHLRVS